MTSRKHRRSSRHGNGETEAAVPFWEDTTGTSPAVFLLTSIVFGGGLLLGGSGGSFGDTLVQLLALPLIVLAAIQWSQSRLQGPDWAALAIIAGIALLAVIQLVPIPLSWWAELPGRAELLRDLKGVGDTSTSQSLSLNPFATERALQWTLPAIATFLAVRWMSARQQKMMLLILFIGALLLLALTLIEHTAPEGNALATANAAIAKADVALALVQASAQPPPPAEFITGLFSNRNHFATFLAMTIPLIVAFGIRVWLDRTKGQPYTWFPWASLLVLVVIGLLTGIIQTHSRAALVLGPISFLSSLMLLRDLAINRKVVWAIVASSVVGALVAFEIAASVTIARLDTSPDTDLRWKIHATTLQAAQHFGVLGSGLGTFVQAYQQVPPVEGFLPDYINRAHGDYHELWLETGLPGAILIVGFIGWFGWSSIRAWRDSGRSDTATLIARAATLSILMVLLHSYVDYPLRKTAILVLFGMSCAMLTPVSERIGKGSNEKSVARA